MHPEDRVLVGIINRVRDLRYAREQHWYRIPQARLPHGVHAEYLAFFLSRAFKERNGGIHYFARAGGIELLYRKDILPAEADHPRANDVYYKISLREWYEKTPPVHNPTKRPITFIYTTWDRFVTATTIADLYSTADYYVDRIFHALRDRKIYAERYWEAERRTTQRAPGLRILCDNGAITASTEPEGDDLPLDPRQPEDAILQVILQRIANQGGPVALGVPHDM
ncbi:MAG: hypothetical protein KJ065_09900 [Anaerolineae bacterium]|nr:hypothetical protein [Anaerolineae bacterium]